MDVLLHNTNKTGGRRCKYLQEDPSEDLSVGIGALHVVEYRALKIGPGGVVSYMTYGKDPEHLHRV